MTICEYIDSILKDREISRRKLAIAAGISPSSLQSALQRNGKLSLDMLVPIVRVLGIDWPEIIKFGYDPDEFVSTVGKITEGEALLFDQLSESEDFVDWTRFVDENGNQLFHSRKEYLNMLKETDAESRLLKSFWKLNDIGKTVAIERVKELTEMKRYQKKQ